MRRWLHQLTKLPLGIKMPLTFAAIVFMVALAIISFIVTKEWFEVEERLQTQARQLTGIVAETIKNFQLRRDYWRGYEGLQHIVHELPEDFSELTMVIVDRQGNIFTSNRPGIYRVGDAFSVSGWPGKGFLLDRWNETLSGSMAVRMLDEPLGRVFFRASISRAFSQKRVLILEALFIAALIGLIGAYAGWQISRRMTLPINAMANAIPYLEQGQYHLIPEIPIHDRDEIGRLALLFNRMRREINSRRELEKQMLNSERLAAMGRLAVGAAHEIRNPLGGILNSLKTLKHHAYDPSVRESCIQTMEVGLSQIEHIVSSMLGFSRDASLNEPLNRENMLKVVSLLQIEKEHAAVQTHLSWNADETIALPASPIQQLVFNLAQNAIHASSPGSSVEIRVEQLHDQGILSIEVEDQGSGIPAAVADKVLEPFWSSKASGTGLGLWVCCRIVDELHGMIRLESEENQGTLFQVQLPIEATMEETHA